MSSWHHVGLLFSILQKAWRGVQGQSLPPQHSLQESGARSLWELTDPQTTWRQAGTGRQVGSMSPSEVTSPGSGSQPLVSRSPARTFLSCSSPRASELWDSAKPTAGPCLRNKPDGAISEPASRVGTQGLMQRLTPPMPPPAAVSMLTQQPTWPASQLGQHAGLRECPQLHLPQKQQPAASSSPSHLPLPRQRT